MGCDDGRGGEGRSAAAAAAAGSAAAVGTGCVPGALGGLPPPGCWTGCSGSDRRHAVGRLPTCSAGVCTRVAAGGWRSSQCAIVSNSLDL